MFKLVPNSKLNNTKFFKIYTEILGGFSIPGIWNQQIFTSWMLTKICECVLSNADVQKLMHSGEQFDLVLSEVLQTHTLFAFAQHFNATHIGFSSFGNDYHIDDYMGNVSPLSYNPLVTSPRYNPMSFYERLENIWEVLVERLGNYLIHFPAMQKQYAKYFPNAKVKLSKVQDSFSLMLLGQHFSLSYPRPYLPNMIEVGGWHIAEEIKPLPADIKNFIESSPEGVIYFSLGSNVQSKDLPLATRETLLKVFAGLKQRVLWKFEDDQMPNKPDNVLISKWFPQPDILAHPNVKLFITHGGLLSTIESIYYGKPVLGLPVFYDQFLNVKRATRMGYGLGLDLQNLKQTELIDSINKLLNTPSYAKTASVISERYRDQPDKSLDRAVWWTEYVLRHKGAAHMRATSRDLNFVQLHSLDTLAVLLGIPLLALLLLIITIRWALRKLLGDKSKRADKQKRQ